MLRSLLVQERGTETVEWTLIGGLVVGGLVLTVIAVSVWLTIRGLKACRPNLGSETDDLSVRGDVRPCAIGSLWCALLRPIARPIDMDPSH